MDPNTPTIEAPSSEAGAPLASVDLAAMNRAELVDHATNVHGLSFKNSDTKADIMAAIRAANGEGSSGTRKYVTRRLVAAGKLDANKRPIIHPIGLVVELSDENAADLLASQAIAVAFKEVAL